MFRLANFSDEEIDDLYRYLSSTASKVICNALDIWSGCIPAVLDIYLSEFSADAYGEGFFEGISQFVSMETVRPEITEMSGRLKKKGYEINTDGIVGMEFLMRKTNRMMEKMKDSEKYYTFDLFEEFLFSKMLDSYVPEIYDGEEDPFIITSDDDLAASAEKLETEFHVGEDLEYETGEEGIGKEYACFLAHTIHRVDQMPLSASDEAGFESLFFWDDDYDIVFSDGFVNGIRGLVSGKAAILGYGYKDVTDIFTDIGIKPPLLLTGSEAAFDTVGETVQKKMAEAMENLPFSELSDEFREIPEEIDDELPFN